MNIEIEKILEKHEKWLTGREGGERANLYGANLRRANLCRADLREANLCGANLREANLCGANLREANLCGANLCRADLRGANLRGANLCRAYLREANLCGADLREANLCGANLREANLCGANLRGANLREAKNTSLAIWDRTTSFFQLQCPEIGAFIGWKKAGNYIIKLEITENAKRSSATTRKCRCSEARVIAIENIDGSNSGFQEVTSNYDSSFIYRVGKIVKVDNFDEDRWNECAPGIHFFITREEAVSYY